MSTAQQRIDEALAQCTFPRYFDARALLEDIQNNAPVESILVDSGYVNGQSFARAMVKYTPHKLKGVTFLTYIKSLVGEPDVKKESRKFGLRPKNFDSIE